VAGLTENAEVVLGVIVVVAVAVVDVHVFGQLLAAGTPGPVALGEE